MKKVLSIKRLRKSFGYAFKGIDDVIKHEPNMKIHVVVAILVVIMAFILKVSIIEWIILVLLIGAVLAAETINTTIENLVDMYTKEYDEKAKIVKDTAAGTVLILAITSAIIGLIIFIPKIIYLLESL
ncbi:MAG: diacylglycerol kinase family protein [Tenericutes bacterium]|nr:diacylglycerol kinase family protein [Mycoplasmatota bacterium]